MKRRAEEEPDEHTPPLKQSRLTPWQQHLKNYAKTEGMNVAEPFIVVNLGLDAVLL